MLRNPFILLILQIVMMGGSAGAASPFKNMDFLRKTYNFKSLYSQTAQKHLKVAVLDKGFEGYKKEIGNSLPKNTRYFPGPVAAPAEVKVEHGLRMAQILYDLSSNNGTQDSAIQELRLYNVFGFSNFQAAIAAIIADKVDLVLYSEVWEFGNNFDGHGFIDAEVSKAINAGVIWVNAAGNFGQTTYNSSIQTYQDQWVSLPDQNHSLSLRCEENPEKKCPVKIVLSWNDFTNDANGGTSKDLDLALTDDLLNVVEASSLKQTVHKDLALGETSYPREIITAELKPGQYYIRVKKSSDNFIASDRLRITVDGENISMRSSDQTETLLNPADLKGVIAVGAWDSARTGISVKMNKPDIWTLSSIIFEDGKEFRGSSNSAAIVAAAVVLEKALKPKLTGADILAQLSFATSWRTVGLSLNQLGFTPKSGSCFSEVFIPNLPEHVQAIMARGAKLVETNFGLRLMTPYDPVTLGSNLRRTSYNDVILASYHGLRAQSRFMVTNAEDIEVFQRPTDAGPCVLPQNSQRFLGF